MVTDGGGAVIGGARQAWRDAELWRCEWHLGDNLLRALPKPVQADLKDPLRVALGSAQFSVEHWEPHPVPGRQPRRQAPAVHGPLEQFFNTLGHRIGDRSANMTNRRRANALLKLMALDYTAGSTRTSATDILRQHLARRRGLAAHQRRHTDPRTAPSLR